MGGAGKATPMKKEIGSVAHFRLQGDIVVVPSLSGWKGQIPVLPDEAITHDLRVKWFHSSRKGSFSFFSFFSFRLPRFTSSSRYLNEGKGKFPTLPFSPATTTTKKSNTSEEKAFEKEDVRDAGNIT